MMLRYLVLTTILCTISISGYCQDNFYFSQYFQVAPAINPALTGMDDFLDIKINYRSQWSGFNDSPSTNYFGINGSLKKKSQQAYKEYALRISNPEILDSLSNITNSFSSKLKHGLGGFVVFDQQGPFEQITGFINYAIHIPIGYKTKLSIGVSGGLVNNRINYEKITLADPDNDEYYQQLLAQGGKNSYFDLNPGLAIYSDKWFISYSAHKAVRKALSTDEILDYDNSINHNMLLGLKFNLGLKSRLIPSVYYSYTNDYDNFWEANVRTIINEKPWFGVSYRSNKTLVFMAGVFVNNLINISYSYDYVMSGLNNYTNGSHEIHFGLMLNKKDLKSPYLW